LKLDYWEHAKPEILKQGRVSYFDGNKLLNPNGEDEEQSEISSDGGDEKKTNYNDIPIPLFSSCSGDRLINDVSPWSIRLSDAAEKTVLVQSHVWPGAYAFVKEG
jgi:Radial spokehead-like protein